MSDTYERLVSLLKRLHEAPEAQVRPEATYVDLEVDSLTMVEISLWVEREWGIVLDTNDLSEEQTLAATVALIDSKRPQMQR